MFVAIKEVDVIGKFSLQNLQVVVVFQLHFIEFFLKNYFVTGIQVYEVEDVPIKLFLEHFHLVILGLFVFLTHASRRPQVHL